MKIVFFSDTHGKHGYIDSKSFKDADTAIFCGDFSPGRGLLSHDLENFAIWFSTISVKNKLFISGNHDGFMEAATSDEIQRILDRYTELIYLNDNGITIDGIKFWGSPITPYFHNWSFNRFPEDISKHWDIIPNGSDRPDVLITHGPSHGILDQIDNRWSSDHLKHVGCPQLKMKIDEIKPQVHAAGHIHEGYGMETHDGVIYINSSIVDKSSSPVNKPITIEIFPRM